MAASFVVASLPGARPDKLVDALARVMPDRPVDRLHPEDRPLDIDDAEAVVLGMGRVGLAAHERLVEEHGLRVVGVEASSDRARHLAERGISVVQGDATDPRLWTELRLHQVNLVLLAMPEHDNNLAALTRLRGHGYDGTVAVVTQFDDDLAEAVEAGADAAFQLYDGAGSELADRAVAASSPRRP